MKSCLICGNEAADDVATCPNDGEASWSDSVTGACTVEDGEAASNGSNDAPAKARRAKR